MLTRMIEMVAEVLKIAHFVVPSLVHLCRLLGLLRGQKTDAVFSTILVLIIRVLYYTVQYISYLQPLGCIAVGPSTFSTLI